MLQTPKQTRYVRTREEGVCVHCDYTAPLIHAGTGSSAAGIWGSYNCDLANTTLHNLMEYLSSIQDQVRERSIGVTISRHILRYGHSNCRTSCCGLLYRGLDF